MKINIWSDIRCPFCYIGKRKFERALERFPHKDKVEVIWRSFQLDPELQTTPGLHVYDYLAKIKGLSRDQAVQMHGHVRKAAAEAGLHFNFDDAVVANSFKAHRLIQMAKTKGVGDEAKERLFRAHFTDGKNIDEDETLIEIGAGLGLSTEEVEAMLKSEMFISEVVADESAARSIGIRGVPFFILNDSVAVSGAQSSALFLQALEKAWEEYELANK
jgi:protein disulfide-isomerase